MEQERKQVGLQQQERAHQLICPRCSSTDTKFRYYNNHSLSQPRHYCRTCKRQWTVGGKLRDIPVGGNTYNRPYRQLVPLPLADQLENSDSQTPMAEMVPQNFGTTGIQPFTNSPEPLPPLTSFYLNDEISCLDASLIQPAKMGQTANTGNQFGIGSADMAFLQDWDIKPMVSHQVKGQIVNTGNQFGSGSDDMAFLQDWDFKPMVKGQTVNTGNQISIGNDDMACLQDWDIKPKPMASHQALPQQIPGYLSQANIADPVMIKPNPIYDQANNYATPYQVPDYNLVQPTWPMNFFPQNTINNFNYSTPNARLWRNSSGHATDPGMPSTSANPNQWPKFPSYGHRE